MSCRGSSCQVKPKSGSPVTGSSTRCRPDTIKLKGLLSMGLSRIPPSQRGRSSKVGFQRRGSTKKRVSAPSAIPVPSAQHGRRHLQSRCPRGPPRSSLPGDQICSTGTNLEQISRNPVGVSGGSRRRSPRKFMRIFHHGSPPPGGKGTYSHSRRPVSTGSGGRGIDAGIHWNHRKVGKCHTGTGAADWPSAG